MRAIRQSDIEIAKAEVDILRSLGMEPDREALLLAQLDGPPTSETVVPEAVVEVNGEAVEVEAAPIKTFLSSTGIRPFRRGQEYRPSASDDEIDIALVLPASEDTTMMHIRMENLSGGAQDVSGIVEVAQVDDHLFFSKGVRVGKHSRSDSEPIVDEFATPAASRDLALPKPHIPAVEKRVGVERVEAEQAKDMFATMAEAAIVGRAFRWGKLNESSEDDTA